MSKLRVSVTQTYQTVATGVAIITIVEKGKGALYIDDTGDDDTAYKTTLGPGDQFEQTETVITQVRADSDDWVIVVDGVL